MIYCSFPYDICRYKKNTMQKINDNGKLACCKLSLRSSIRNYSMTCLNRLTYMCIDLNAMQSLPKKKAKKKVLHDQAGNIASMGDSGNTAVETITCHPFFVHLSVYYCIICLNIYSQLYLLNIFQYTLSSQEQSRIFTHNFFAVLTLLNSINWLESQ